MPKNRGQGGVSSDVKKDESYTGQLKQFAVDSQRFMDKCEKPNKDEYMKILTACSIGFVVMGLIGYFIKLIFIPINNIILGTNGATT
ncbi:unnamed protein product [Moneuplotes crassus]|uniref:Uncharacterized protein n=1 Tax=Euplotes crassus TaxID=5936 RepID=A0AAD1XVV0_EUPCR|nr:unnamed protein product [Moneuplotes crassus]|mmetsp:Transcript_26065/g.25911  ORF Transcript_26065/g.25911 Transcript_26065/m.25911 type:complete len:87 (-) Transcript_26065:54-314(-)